MRTAGLIVAILVACVAAAPVAVVDAQGGGGSGRIRGRVTVPESPPELPRPTIGALASPAVHPTVDRRRVVVYLESAPRYAFDDLQPGRARMDQRDEQFVPHLLAITVGTSVEFPNNDTTFHNVFSLSRAKPFDLGRYRPGRTGSVVFDRPGIVAVFCDIHTHMSAYILVFSHPFFDVSTTDGRYEIGNVPPGSYSLRVWSELGTAEPRPVVVRQGETTDVNVRVTRDRP